MHRHSHHKHFGGRRARMLQRFAEHMPEHMREHLREAIEEKMEAGRFGRGRHGHGHDEDGEGGGMGFGRGWGGPRMGGRMLGHGDLRLLLLALIGEKPRHGYDLIKAVEERFAGAYAPSPGAVYPTLTMLEEQDFIRAEASEGSKKLFAITDEGRKFLADNEAQVDGILTRVGLAASHYSSRSAPDEVWEAWKTLKQAMNMPRGKWTDAEATRIRTILTKAAKDIVGKG